MSRSGTEIVDKIIEVLRTSSTDQLRLESMRRIALEELNLALHTLDDRKIEEARQKCIDIQAEYLDNYIMHAKKLHILRKEGEDAAS